MSPSGARAWDLIGADCIGAGGLLTLNILLKTSPHNGIVIIEMPGLDAIGETLPYPNYQIRCSFNNQTQVARCDYTSLFSNFPTVADCTLADRLVRFDLLELKASARRSEEDSLASSFAGDDILVLFVAVVAVVLLEEDDDL